MDKDRLMLDYLKALLDRYGKYHDHKELSAWASIVLYFAFGAAVLNVENPKTVLEFGIILGVVLLAAVLVTLFIQTQLNLKDVAGSYAGAATYFMTELLTTGQLKEPLTAIAQSADTELQSSHVLSESFLKKANWLNTQGRCAQIKTRLFTYSLLWVAVLFIVARKTLKFFC